MAFAIEAVLPIELEIPSFQVQNFDEMVNEIMLRSKLDGIEEAHEAVKKTSYLQQIKSSAIL